MLPVHHRAFGDASETAASGDVENRHSLGPQGVEHEAGRGQIDATQHEPRLLVPIHGDRDDVLLALALVDHHRGDAVAVDLQKDTAGARRLHHLLDLDRVRRRRGRQGHDQERGGGSEPTGTSKRCRYRHRHPAELA